MVCGVLTRAGTKVGGCGDTRARSTALAVVVALRALVRGRLFGFPRCQSRGRDDKLRSRRPEEAGRHALPGRWSTTLSSRRPLKDSRRAMLASRLAKLSSSDAIEMSSVAMLPERCAKEAERRVFLVERPSPPPEKRGSEAEFEAIETWIRAIQAESVVLLSQSEATNESSCTTERSRRALLEWSRATMESRLALVAKRGILLLAVVRLLPPRRRSAPQHARSALPSRRSRLRDVPFSTAKGGLRPTACSRRTSSRAPLRASCGPWCSARIRRSAPRRCSHTLGSLAGTGSGCSGCRCS